MLLYWWLESDYHTLKSFMSRLNRTNIVRSFGIVRRLLTNILKGYLNGIIKGFVRFFVTPTFYSCKQLVLQHVIVFILWFDETHLKDVRVDAR